MEGELIFVCSPFCGWCYSVKKEVEELREKFLKKFEFKMIHRVIVCSTLESPKNIELFWRKIEGEVENMESGKKLNFVYGVSKERNFPVQGEKAAYALLSVRELEVDKEFDFYEKILTSFYVEGNDMNNDETYLQIACDLRLDKEKFLELFTSDYIRIEMVKKEEQRFLESKVEIVPSFLLKKKNDEHARIMSTYSKNLFAEEVIDNIKKSE